MIGLINSTKNDIKFMNSSKNKLNNKKKLYNISYLKRNLKLTFIFFVTYLT